MLAIAGKPGWGHQPVLQAIEESPARNRIRLLGYVSDDDLPALLTGAAVAAYVSLYEGFGLPVLEAMACGAPVLTSSVSSMPEVAGDAALLVDPYEVGSIARGLASLLGEDASARARHRSAAMSRAAQFSWSRTARDTYALYQSLR